MTMKIEVTIPESEVSAGSAAAYLTAAMTAIGFQRGVNINWNEALTAAASAQEDTPDEAIVRGIREAVAQDAAAEAAQTEAPKRERGKPAPGRARRTKEEIAEDEAADKAEASAHATEETPLISTGEERIDPITAEDAAQDAADEAAEVEATKAPELTHDDVRAALQKYLAAYGTPAAMEDGPKVLTMLFGAEVTKVSAVPGDQASLAKTVAGIEEMTTKNPFKRRVDL